MTADRVDCGDCPNLGGCQSGHCIRAREISSAAFERSEAQRMTQVSGIDALAFGIDLAKGPDLSSSWGPYQTAGKVVTSEPVERPRSAPAESGSVPTSAGRSPDGGPDSGAGASNLLEEIERTFAALSDRRAERWLLLGPDGRVWSGPDPMVLAAKATWNPPEAPPLPIEPKDYVTCTLCWRLAAPGEGCASPDASYCKNPECIGRKA